MAQHGGGRRNVKKDRIQAAPVSGYFKTQYNQRKNKIIHSSSCVSNCVDYG